MDLFRLLFTVFMRASWQRFPSSLMPVVCLSDVCLVATIRQSRADKQLVSLRRQVTDSRRRCRSRASLFDDSEMRDEFEIIIRFFATEFHLALFDFAFDL
jgi:hypothetical protein